MFILPIPQQFQLTDEVINAESFAVQADDTALYGLFGNFFDENGETQVFFHQKPVLDEEAYELRASNGKIEVLYGTTVGAWRAFTTLRQIIAQAEDGKIPGFEIFDYPDISNRGYMLDVSRGKIPSLAYLKELVDILAALKYNQLQLYMDKFVYEYKNFPEYCQDTEPLTRAEIMELDAYCKERFIELVPNQNGFGHMQAWLAKKELADLAIIRDDEKPSATLNPLDPRSVELVDRIFDGFLDAFSSSLVNIGMDEPFELGMGQTKEVCEEMGVGRVYTDYLNQICRLAAEKYGKNPMFWGDIIFLHPEELERIPKDAIVMEWGYENEQHFDRGCSRLKEKGYRFYVCPGTSMWRSYTGRTNNAVLNIYDAADCAKYYGAEGFLLTEWGSDAHPQFPAPSYFTMVYAGALCWNAGPDTQYASYVNRGKVLEWSRQYLDRFLYHTTKGSLADIVCKIGNYYLLEGDPRWNSSQLEYYIRTGAEVSEAQRQNFELAYDYMLKMKAELSKVEAEEIAKRETEIGCDIVLVLLDALLAHDREKTNVELKRVIAEYRMLWELKNHTSGVEWFTGILQSLIRE